MPRRPACLQVGIEVDAFLRTSHPDIFAAGDVVNFYNPVLDKRMRVEHEENANLTGMLAGHGMAGQPTAYEHLPCVYSTLFECSYDAVGELDPRLDIVYDWQEPFRKGTAYYLEKAACAACCCGIFRAGWMPPARSLPSPDRLARPACGAGLWGNEQSGPQPSLAQRHPYQERQR